MVDGPLTTEKILDIFSDEVQTRRGRVTEAFRDGGRLFVRSLLPHIADVRPNDGMQGGLALRAIEEELWLHPYLFRQVCRNGAITAHTIESLHVECLDVYSAKEGTVMLREAIAVCSEEQVFTKSIRQIRSSATSKTDELLNLMPFLSHFQKLGMGRFLPEIVARFFGEHDRTQFGFMNAITSLARDTRDPDDRWTLEELGGGIGARLWPRQPNDARGRQRAERDLAPVF